MNQTHIHLLLNHFPVIGTLIGSCLLLWGIIKKNGHTKSIAAFLLAVMALIAIPVFLTGEPAEESVEGIAGVSENMISLHEEAAEIAIWLMGITGIISLAALFMAWKKHKQANIAFLVAFIFSAVCFASMARTGYLGGQIRHTEISNPANTDTQVDKEQGKEADGDKDDD
ncbi:MAG: hypothetical protein WAR78_03425 [Ferruginibacter sp.]